VDQPAGQVMQHKGNILRITEKYDCWRNGIEAQDFVPLGSAEP
jgi:hypothetical protein